MKYFITLLKCSNFIIGNSSAGIREVPYFGVPSIDLGNSQKFKRGAKVLKNIEYNEKKILYYIYKIKKKFKNSFHFRYGNSTKKIQIL